jgi:hypothetical protein
MIWWLKLVLMAIPEAELEMDVLFISSARHDGVLRSSIALPA